VGLPVQKAEENNRFFRYLETLRGSKLTLSFNVNSHNTLSITLHEEREGKRRAFGILSFGGRGYRKQLFNKLLSTIDFRFQKRGRFSAYMVAHVDSKLVDILEALEKVERVNPTFGGKHVASENSQHRSIRERVRKPYKSPI